MDTLFPRVFESLLPTLAASARGGRGGEPGDVEDNVRMNLKLWSIVSQRMSEKDVRAPLPPICLKPATEICSLAVDESSVCLGILGLADRVRPKSGSTLLLDWSLSCMDESLRSNDILKSCQDFQKENAFRMEILGTKMEHKDNWLEQLLAQFDEDECWTVDDMKKENKENIDTPDDLSYDSAKNKKNEMISMLSKVSSRKPDGCEHTMESSDLSLPRLEVGVHEKMFQPPNEIIHLLVSIKKDLSAFLSQRLPWREAAQFDGFVVGDSELIHAAEQAVLDNASPEKQSSRDTFLHLRYMADFAFNLAHRGLHQAFVLYNKGCLGNMSSDVISGMAKLGRMVEGLEVEDSPKHSLLKQALVTVSTTTPDARQLIIADQASFMNLYGVIQGCHLSVFQYSTYYGSPNVIQNLEVDCFLASVAEMRGYLQAGAALDMSPFAHVVVYESDICTQTFLVDMIGSISVPITLLRTSLEALLGDAVKMQASVTEPDVFVENQHSVAVQEPGMQFDEMGRNLFGTGKEIPMAMGIPVLGSLGLNPAYDQTFQIPPPINCLPRDTGIPLQQAWGGFASHFVDNTSMYKHDNHLNQEVDMSRSFDSISQPYRKDTGFVEPQTLTSSYMHGENRNPRVHMERYHQPPKTLFEVQERYLYPYAPPNSPQHFGESGPEQELEFNGQSPYEMVASYPPYDPFTSYNACQNRPSYTIGCRDRASDGLGELSQTADHRNQESLNKTSLFDELPKKPFILDERRFQSAYESIVDNPIEKLESLYESMRKPKRLRGKGEGFTSRCLRR